MLVVSGTKMTLAYIVLSVAVLFVAASAQQTTGNNFIFNAGSCYSSDCRCFGECCEQQAVEPLLDEAYNRKAPANNSEIPLEYIGKGEDFMLNNCDRCDHANDSTSIFLQKFDYDGDLKWCKWYMHYDCSDTILPMGSNTKRSDAFPNNLIRFGIFDRDDSLPFAFKLLGYITLQREVWYPTLLNDLNLPVNGGEQFNYTFTRNDKQDLGVSVGSLKGKYIGFSWSVGGAVCYQKPIPSLLTGSGMMAIFDQPEEFGSWDQIDMSSHTFISTTMTPKQLHRHYNMRCAYKPFSV